MHPYNLKLVLQQPAILKNTRTKNIYHEESVLNKPNTND